MSITHRIDPSSIRVIEHGGPFGEGAPDYARERVAALAKYTVRPILFAKVRLIRHVEPAAVVAKGTVDVDGEVSFAQAHGLSPREAIDLMVDQLRKEITEQSGSRSALGRRSPEE